jgi:hypothetical protein
MGVAKVHPMAGQMVIPLAQMDRPGNEGEVAKAWTRSLSALKKAVGRVIREPNTCMSTSEPKLPIVSPDICSIVIVTN